MTIVVTEKYSVADAIDEALKHNGVRNVRITWVRGHVMDIDLPKEFRVWRLRDVVDILKIREFTSRIVDWESYSRLRESLGDSSRLVIATDNDHEGELIGYEILMLYKRLHPHGKYYRMRFNSIDRGDLIRAWNNLQSELNWRWVYKAMFRHRFDLLTGAAYTRLLTLANKGRMASNGYSDKMNHNRIISWGSCQTPTLYFIVKREREILSFKSKYYWYIEAELEYGGIRFIATSKHIYSKEEADMLYSTVKSDHALVSDYVETRKVMHRPLPIRTDDALRDLVKITSVSASKIMQVMEDLYSKAYISYPRTDTNKYSSTFEFSKPMREACNGLGIGHMDKAPEPRNGNVDDGAHPPIYPVKAYRGSGIARIVWEYIARRFLSNAYLDDALLLEQSSILNINDVEFHAHGSRILEYGYLSLFNYFMPRESLLPVLNIGDKARVLSIRLVRAKTKPPSRLGEAELLDMMERHGIGTDATRADFPTLIVKRGYAVKYSNRFKPTSMGMALIDALESIDARLVTADTRRLVEETMKSIEDGDIKDYNIALDGTLRVYSDMLMLCKKRMDIIRSISKLSKTDTGSGVGKAR